MNDGEIVERLRRHYDDVPELTHEPNPEFDNLIGQFESGPETFRKVLVRGLDGIRGRGRPNRRRKQYGKIRRTDVGGSRLVEADLDLSYVAIMVPEKILKKLDAYGASEGIRGAVFDKSFFKVNSPLIRGVEYLILLADEDRAYLEHEKSHVRYHRHNRSEKDIVASLDREINGEKKRIECVRLMALHREHYVLSEILAKGVSKKNEVFMDSSEKKFYAGYLAKSFVETMDRHGLYALPNVDGIAFNRLVKDKLASSYEELFDAGIKAFNTLYRNLPEKIVAKIVFSCGLKNGECGFGPVQELVEWSKRYKEVLKSE